MPTEFKTHEDIMTGFRSLTAPGTAFIKHNTDSSVNVLFVQFRNYQGEDHFVSIVINRWHDNVNSMFGETSRLNASKDTMDFIDGSVGSYPNYFLQVEGVDIPDFFDVMANFDGSAEYSAKFRKFGINRANHDFWSAYEWFQQRLDEADPVRAGLYDLNRYHPQVDEGTD
jgi:hypothetical protein